MKEIWMIVGFGAGLVTGALLYKHSQEAKQLVNKGEKTNIALSRQSSAFYNKKARHMTLLFSCPDTCFVVT